MTTNAGGHTGSSQRMAYPWAERRENEKSELFTILLQICRVGMSDITEMFLYYLFYLTSETR